MYPECWRGGMATGKGVLHARSRGRGLTGRQDLRRGFQQIVPPNDERPALAELLAERVPDRDDHAEPTPRQPGQNSTVRVSA
jgi:hypothetical protein